VTINLLPSQFSYLEVFAKDWALPLESQRNYKRITSSMTDLQSLYDAVLPRLEEIVAYLNQYPLDRMPEDAKRLLNLSYSMMEIAQPVEVLGRPNMPDSVEDSRLEYISERTAAGADRVTAA
jgi:hypothetical protein